MGISGRPSCTAMAFAPPGGRPAGQLHPLHEQRPHHGPPLHELAQPVTPHLPSPGTVSHARDNPGVRMHDCAYANDAVPAQAQMHHAFSNRGAPFSPQSKTSTTILQYNLISARNGNGNSRSSGSGSRDALTNLQQMIGVVQPQSRSEKLRVRERERAAWEDEREWAAQEGDVHPAADL